jgi:hypothetical protein
VPSGHAAGATPLAQNKPDGHTADALDEPVGQKLPAGQAAAATPPPAHMKPAGHGIVLLGAPGAHMTPALHAVQLAALGAPDPAKNVPAGHLAHAAELVALVALLYVPAGHGTGGVPRFGRAAQMSPAGHGVVAFVAPDGQYTPAGHARHAPRLAPPAAGA